MSSPFAMSLLSSAGGESGSILSLLFLPLILLAMYFLLFRPQRKRLREQQQLQQSVQVGDEVVTTSGVFGTITGEDGPTRFWLEIDDENEVQIRIARAAIQNVVNLDDEDSAALGDADADVATSSDD